MQSKLSSFKLKNKRVLLRIDGNVPLAKDGEIQNLFRLQRVRPTIDYILGQGAQVIILTHIGRPKKQEEYLSTKILHRWFALIGYDILFALTVEDAQHIPFKAHQIVMLENVRFFKGEQNNDINFAQQLASLGDLYVNDAFGTMHRYDTSITLLAQQFKKNKKTIGFLTEKELQQLDMLQQKNNRPFIALIGGGKIETKLPLLAHLTNLVDIIGILPALSFSFEQTNDNPVGQSLVHENAKKICTTITKLAKKHNCALLLPSDYLVAQDVNKSVLSCKTITAFNENDLGIAIGPKTLTIIEKELKNASAVFYNGIMGFADHPDTLVSSKQLLTLISKSNAYSVIAGGDTVALAQSLGIDNKFNFVSTGGGAALQYIAGQVLPGLEAIQ